MRVAPPVIAFGGKVELLFVLQGGRCPSPLTPPDESNRFAPAASAQRSI
jgi:hypothetical protein